MSINTKFLSIMSRRPSKQKPPLKAKFSSTLPPTHEKVKGQAIAKIKPKKSPSTWEKIILYYLSQLKNFFGLLSCDSSDNHPIAGKNETSVDTFRRNQANSLRDNLKKKVKTMEPEPDRYSSKCHEILRRRRSITSISSGSEAGTSTTTVRESRQQKAAKIVSAAIDYGCATGIIRNNGKYFWLKRSVKGNPIRSPAPPSKLCDLCSNAYKRKRHFSSRDASPVSICSSASTIQNARIKEKRIKCQRGAKRNANPPKTPQQRSCFRNPRNRRNNSPQKHYNLRWEKCKCMK